MGSIFDGIVGGHSLCTLGGRHSNSDREQVERGALSVRVDGMKAIVDVDDSSNSILGETKDGCRPSPWRAAGLLPAG